MYNIFLLPLIPLESFELKSRNHVLVVYVVYVCVRVHTHTNAITIIMVRVRLSLFLSVYRSIGRHLRYMRDVMLPLFIFSPLCNRLH